MALVSQIIFIIVSILSLILAFWVLLSRKKGDKSSIGFFWTAISIFAWMVTGYIGMRYDFHPLLFLRLNYAIVSFFFIATYFLSIFFPSETGAKRWVSWALTAIALLFGVISTSTDLLVEGIANHSPRELQMGPLSNIFYAYVLIITIFILFNLSKNYYKQSKENKSKIFLFILGAFLFALFNIVFNVIVPLMAKGSSNYYAFGDYSAIFFLAFTAYAIVKHQLFNIKVIATETTVVALSIGLLMEVFISNSAGEGILKAIIWILATYGGYILIKSVKNEIKQKEELQDLYKDLKEANKHLKELDETKDNFLSMAAHELNTPISAIEGYLSMIVDEKMCGDLGEQANKYLGNVYNSSKRLAALVKDLLNVSRIESNRIHLIYEEVQFEDMIDECINEIKIKADQQQHELIWNRPQTPLPKTWLDKSRITEVIINLLGNAVKYTEPGGRIEIEAHTDGNKIVFSIQDNGRGIPKDKKIFEKFVQVDVLKDEVKGTGLGMFISKNLVELHGGKIWYTSSTGPEDHGTRFFFSTPILPNKPADQFEGQGAVLQLK